MLTEHMEVGAAKSLYITCDTNSLPQVFGYLIGWGKCSIPLVPH